MRYENQGHFVEAWQIPADGVGEELPALTEGFRCQINSHGGIDLLGGRNVMAGHTDPGDWIILDDGFLTWMPDARFRETYTAVG